MKKLICFLILVLSFALYAQGQDISNQYSPQTHTSKGFNPENGVQAGSITVEGKAFQCFETNSGSLYVKAPNSKGGTYAIWIGSPTKETYQGKQVRIFKSGTKCYLELSTKGYPHPVYLTKKTKKTWKIKRTAYTTVPKWWEWHEEKRQNEINAKLDENRVENFGI